MKCAFVGVMDVMESDGLDAGLGDEVVDLSRSRPSPQVLANSLLTAVRI
jgi:hypothetical protein